VIANKDWLFLFDKKPTYNEDDLFKKLNNYANRLPELELLKMQQKHNMEENNQFYFDQKKAFDRAVDAYKPREMVYQNDPHLKNKYSLGEAFHRLKGVYGLPLYGTNEVGKFSHSLDGNYLGAP
jgi:hypothetical protein